MPTIDRSPLESDYPRWRELYQGYADFYRVAMTDEHARTLWGYLHDPQHESECLLARGQDGGAIGLAHVRRFARPLNGTNGLFLDDLFVDPAARGLAIGDLLLAEARAIAKARGYSVVRWITADDNYRARGLYDQVATRTGWLTYDMPPA